MPGRYLVERRTEMRKKANLKVKAVVWVRVGVAQCFSGDVGRAAKVYLTSV
jgi:hypothetical protein